MTQVAPQTDCLYAAHFGLSAEPFSPAPSPHDLQMTGAHAEALAALEVGLRNRSGLIVLTGAPGTGKTSVVYRVLSSLGDEVRTAYVAQTSLDFDGLLSHILADFGIRHESKSRGDQLDALDAFLLECAREGTVAAVVIDEAQNLSSETLEQIRLLTNYETFSRKLLQVVLVGAPELDERLASPELQHLGSRVAVHVKLGRLNRAESRAYIEHRLRTAGAALDLFAPAAVNALLRHGRGNPRRLNLLAQNALLFAFGRNQAVVSLADVRAARAALAGHEGATTAIRRAAERSRWLVPAIAATLAAITLATWVFTGSSGSQSHRLRETASKSSGSTTLSVESLPITTGRNLLLDVDTGDHTARRDPLKPLALAGVLIGPLGMLGAALGLRRRHEEWRAA
jgi:general secretion pathway protein A